MSSGAGAKPLTGAELLEATNAANVRQSRYIPITELADYLTEQGISADILIISLLQNIDIKLDRLEVIERELKINNEYNAEAHNEVLTEEDIQNQEE